MRYVLVPWAYPLVWQTLSQRTLLTKISLIQHICVALNTLDDYWKGASTNPTSIPKDIKPIMAGFLWGISPEYQVPLWQQSEEY